MKIMKQKHNWALFDNTWFLRGTLYISKHFVVWKSPYSPYFSSFRFLMAPGEVPAVFPDKRPLSGHLILDNSIPCLLFSNWLSSKCDMVAKNHRVIDRYVLILWNLTALSQKRFTFDGLFAFDPIQFWRVFIHCLRVAHKNGL